MRQSTSIVGADNALFRSRRVRDGRALDGRGERLPPRCVHVDYRLLVISFSISCVVESTVGIPIPHIVYCFSIY